MQENATTTRDIEVPSISGNREQARTIPAGTRVLVFECDTHGEEIFISGPNVGAQIYVETAAVEMDIRPVTSRVYFAVPDDYTIGREFDTWAEAAEAATAEIKPLGLGEWNGGVERYSRAFIDIRQKDANGDRAIQRFEVMRTGEVVPS